MIWTVLTTVVALYLLTGLGFAQLTWPLDQRAGQGQRALPVGYRGPRGVLAQSVTGRSAGRTERTSMKQMISIPVTELLKVERHDYGIEWDCKLCRVGSRVETMEMAVAGFHGHVTKNHHAEVED